MIHNRFICGIQDPKIRSGLLSGDDAMTSTQAFETASAKECANQSSQSMTGSSYVNYVQRIVTLQTTTVVEVKPTTRARTKDLLLQDPFGQNVP